MTPNLWTLPEAVHFADTDWRVHTDFRDVLEILRWLDGSADPALTDSERWYVALALFYRDFSLMPPAQYREACEAMATFVQAGRPDGGPCAPRLMDWQQDAALIAAGTARAAGQDLRALPYLHWWSFLGWFDSIADGPFATWWPCGTSCAAAKNWSRGNVNFTAPTVPRWTCTAPPAPRQTPKSNVCSHF